MSSIVSRRPPLSVSTSQSKDFFWMSMRLGTSRTFSSRAKLRRVRGAAMEAKTATPLGLASGQRAATSPAGLLRWGRRAATEARPAKIAQGYADPCEGRSALTDPVRPGLRMWRRGRGGRLRLSADGQAVYRGAQGAVDRSDRCGTARTGAHAGRLPPDGGDGRGGPREARIPVTRRSGALRPCADTDDPTTSPAAGEDDKRTGFPRQSARRRVCDTRARESHSSGTE